MPYKAKDDYLDALVSGVCTHDEIRQLVGIALGRPGLFRAIEEFFERSTVHLIIDEAFDVNGLDALVVRRALKAGVGVTLVGDPWQAVYEWRGARPDKVEELLADYGFVPLPMLQSFRFKTAETVTLTTRLRRRQPVTLAMGGAGADVVLANAWDHLLDAGADLVPLSFGQFDCQTDASLTLVLDEVVRARLGRRALGVPEAMRCLRRDEKSIDLQPILEMLRNELVSVSAVLDELRVATKIGGSRRPSLPRARIRSRTKRLELLRRWLLFDGAQIPGLSFHQAKGREWARVDVALKADSRLILAKGINDTEEEHRKLYVALTRGSEWTRLRPI